MNYKEPTGMHIVTEYSTPIDHASQQKPMEPVLYFCKSALNERIATFQNGLGGELCYAVKCNSHPFILRAMVDAGIKEFDVASPKEIVSIRSINNTLRMNYNNPVRSREEIKFALKNGVRSFSVDCIEELNKLAELAPRDCEISVRLKLELGGAAYHFGDKFGESTENVVKLLKEVHDLGFITSATFHVGTQCELAENYRLYLKELAKASKQAGITLKRVNVGGGFPSSRNGVPIDYQAFFDAIKDGMTSFPYPLQWLAEPGRALIADACQYLVQIKSMRKGRWAFLNDGVYGGLSEVKLMGSTPYAIFAPDGKKRDGVMIKYRLYGPTCDSIDGFDEDFHFPESTQEEDYLLFHGAGAYLLGLNTSFNGYGEINFEHVQRLSH